LELRVVPLPEGSDPADLLLSEGAEALRGRVARSMPFAVFRVERVLAAADMASAEGRDQALDALRPIVGELPPSVLREELVRRVAGHLQLSDELATTLLAPGRRPSGNGRARAAGSEERPAVP